MEANDESLEAAVASILGFIKRTAEPSETGRTWETIDYNNGRHRDPCIFNGVAGISFFLVDAYLHTGDTEALEYAQGAIDWSVAFSGKHYKRGLHFGKTGAALAALHKSAALGEKSVPEYCRVNADIILHEPTGPVTDLIGGEASNGLYLLKLWKRTGDEAHMKGAERCAAWLELNMIRDSMGTHCRICPDGSLDFPPHSYLGVAHGISGVAHFLACLAEASGKGRWANLAREIFDTMERHAMSTHGGLNWTMRVGGDQLIRCQWSHGAAGIGLTYLTAHRVLGDSRYLDIALQAAEATYGYGDFRGNCTLCTGLAGSGGLFLEVYRATADPLWKKRAREFAQGCIAYKEATPDGDAWPTDGKGLYSADFDYGASGVGHFFLRLLSGGKLELPIM